MEQTKNIAVIGGKGRGKSIKSLEMLYQILNTNDKSKGKPRNIIILDANDEYGTFQYYPFTNGRGKQKRIRQLKLSEVAKFAKQKKKEIVRVRPFFDNGQRMTIEQIAETAEYLKQWFHDGIIYYEDIGIYFSPIKFRELCSVGFRSNNISAIFSFQSIDSFLKYNAIIFVDYIRLHYTNDPVQRHKVKLCERYELFSIAGHYVRNMVKYCNDPYFSLWVDVVNCTINAENKFVSTHFNVKVQLLLAIHQYWIEEGDSII